MPLIIDARQAVSAHMASTHTRLLPCWGALFLLEEVMTGGGGEQSFEELLEKVTALHFFAP